jgi:hypothetical protein
MRALWLTPVLVGLSLTAVFAACLLGSTPLPVDRVFAALFGMGSEADQLASSAQLWVLAVRHCRAFCETL